MEKLPQFPRPFFAVLIIGLEIVEDVHDFLFTIFFRQDKAAKVLLIYQCFKTLLADVSFN